MNHPCDIYHLSMVGGHSQFREWLTSYFLILSRILICLASNGPSNKSHWTTLLRSTVSLCVRLHSSNRWCFASSWTGLSTFEVRMLPEDSTLPQAHLGKYRMADTVLSFSNTMAKLNLCILTVPGALKGIETHFSVSFRERNRKSSRLIAYPQFRSSQLSPRTWRYNLC